MKVYKNKIQGDAAMKMRISTLQLLVKIFGGNTRVNDVIELIKKTRNKTWNANT